MSRELDDTVSAVEVSAQASSRGMHIGQLFAARYRVQAMLGSGGMGALASRLLQPEPVAARSQAFRSSPSAAPSATSWPART